MIGVLFVCTGNICRSPTAEGVFRHRAQRAGLAGRLHIDSAGTHGYHVGEAPDPRAIAHAARRGVDLSPLRARQVARTDFDRFDYVLAMDRGHQRILTRQAGPLSGRVRLYLDFAPQLGLRDVPDPYYGEAADFEQVLDLVEVTSDALLEHVRRRHFAD